jgi:hypothetical protein
MAFRRRTVPVLEIPPAYRAAPFSVTVAWVRITSPELLDVTAPVFPMPSSPWTSNAALSPPQGAAIRLSSRLGSSFQPTITAHLVIRVAAANESTSATKP